MKKKRIIGWMLGAGLVSLFHQSAVWAATVQSIDLIADSFSDGTRLTKVVLRYDAPILVQSLTPDSFQVKGQVIRQAYVSNSRFGNTHSDSGYYVVLGLNPQQQNALIYTTHSQSELNQVTTNTTPSSSDSTAQATSVVAVHAPGIPDYHVALTQALPLKTQKGETIPATKVIYQTNQLINESTIHFMVHDFVDKRLGKTLRYNLYIPKNYNPHRNYPLVFFGHDSGAVSQDARVTLWQGTGATIWASDANQAKHASFVVAPQYDSAVGNENNASADQVKLTVDLIQTLMKQYPIDAHRIYTTGQAGGSALAVNMNIQYPQMFAASYLVADSSLVPKISELAHKPLWLVVSQGDTQAYAAMNTAMATWKKSGGLVQQMVWSGQESIQEVDKLAQEMLVKKANIHYVTLKKGTVVPDGQPDNGVTNRVNSWRIAYRYQPAIDWLFTQSAPNK